MGGAWAWFRLSVVVGVALTISSVRAFVCYATQSSPCLCESDDISERVDLTYYDDNSLTATSKGLRFQYSPCGAIKCSKGDGKHFMICMLDIETGKGYGLGRVTDFVDGNPWNVTSLSPLNFTITYYDGEDIGSTSVYSTVTVVYKEDVIGSNFTFVKSTLQSGNETEIFEFQLLTPHVELRQPSNSQSTDQSWIAGAVVGSWVFLVLVLAAVVLIVILIEIRRYKRKIRNEQYQPLPNPPACNDPA